LSGSIQLIVGLGNPGRKYESTRHNAGFWFVDELARQAGASFRSEQKFQGEVAKAQLGGHSVHLLKPSTFMNLSGQSVAALSRFYQIEPENILVVHDELDLPCGSAKLKKGGGHGGHNGLRDIINHIGKNFNRLRIGIDHPGNARDVVSYVLKSPDKQQLEGIEDAIREADSVIADLLAGDIERAMHKLHTK
jgi:PTH1 family peptidyl-tRNA hydrolase